MCSLPSLSSLPIFPLPLLSSLASSIPILDISFVHINRQSLSPGHTSTADETWYWLRNEWLCIPFKPDFSFREVWSTDCSYVHKMLGRVSTWATVSPVLLCWVPPVLQNKAHQCVHMGHGESSTFVSGSSGTSREACVCKQAISTQGTRILT